MSHTSYSQLLEIPLVSTCETIENKPTCTRGEARELLQLLRNEYRLLSPENRDGVKALLLAFAHNVPNMRSGFTGSKE